MENNPGLAQIRSSKASSQEQPLGKPELSSNPNARFWVEVSQLQECSEFSLQPQVGHQNREP